jgi:hypothetical protein
MMWQFLHLTDIAELVYRKWKRAYKIFKFVGFEVQVYLKERSPNKCQLFMFHEEGAVDGEWKIRVQGGKSFFREINYIFSPAVKI